jgi:hypothetical protein
MAFILATLTVVRTMLEFILTACPLPVLARALRWRWTWQHTYAPGSERNESSPLFEFQEIDAVGVYDIAFQVRFLARRRYLGSYLAI